MNISLQIINELSKKVHHKQNIENKLEILRKGHDAEGWGKKQWKTEKIIGQINFKDDRLGNYLVTPIDQKHYRIPSPTNCNDFIK